MENKSQIYEIYYDPLRFNNYIPKETESEVKTPIENIENDIINNDIDNDNDNYYNIDNDNYNNILSKIKIITTPKEAPKEALKEVPLKCFHVLDGEISVDDHIIDTTDDKFVIFMSDERYECIELNNLARQHKIEEYLLDEQILRELEIQNTLTIDKETGKIYTHNVWFKCEKNVPSVIFSGVDKSKSYTKMTSANHYVEIPTWITESYELNGTIPEPKKFKLEKKGKAPSVISVQNLFPSQLQQNLRDDTARQSGDSCNTGEVILYELVLMP